MKDNRINGADELEKELRNKMSELSSNVDCFEKISARAFPETDQDFSDSELTVSDLENVTGRRRAVPVLKWVSIAAAAVVCIGVLPRTVFFQEFISNIGLDTNKKYRDMISEIKKETELHDYKVFDMPLSEYIADDILISPLYGCPFEAEETDGINVRVFVREIDGVPTNQIYAVEYTGDYSESNFLAGAESKAKFTNKDIDDIGDISTEVNDSKAYRAACNAFTGDRYFLLVDKEGKRATAASFAYVHFFKDDGAVKTLQTEVLYCNYDEDCEKYYYDTLTRCYDKDSQAVIEYNIPEADKLWKTSLNYDGSNAMPKESNSAFNRKDFFADAAEYEDLTETLSWYEPYDLADEALVDDKVQTMRFSENSAVKTFKTPADSSIKAAMRMYEPYITHFMYDSQSDPTIDISIDGRDEQIIVHSGNIEGDFAELGKKTEKTTNYVEFSGDLFIEEQEQMQKNAEINRQIHEAALESEEIRKQAENAAEKTSQPYNAFIFSTDQSFVLSSGEQE
ncbi:hypothetical protein [Ruminococcus flavefaciens]|uniref:hypothetical protein n=1 Tax=Ruminococcus flavefaciens TaxID=1265 RepID=UPI0026F2C86B|nr:hypothetical protein [Ruminococcus flavefaciens]